MNMPASRSILPFFMLLALLFGGLGVPQAEAVASPPAYYPSGPQANVDQSQLAGWTVCWQSSYGSSVSIASIQASCSGAYLLLAGRPAGSAVFDVLAAGPRTDVFFDTGTGNIPHDANGVGWYFNSSWSWGFAPAGAPIQRSSCDTVNSSLNPSGSFGNLRLCWHTGGGNVNAGWRSGTHDSLSSSTYERLIYQSSGALPAAADLAITKTDGVTTAVAGGSVTYTITASNAGPSSATGVTVADTFPAVLTGTWTCVGAGGGTCTASGSGNINDTVNLPAGSSVTYTVSANISAAASGSLANTATVAAGAGTTDPNPANNSATDTDTLASQADLAITKTDGVTTAVAGGSVTYTITASNAGPSNAPGTTVADTFPAALTATWTCVGAGGGTCTASGSGNINDTVNLPAGGSVTYTASASVSAAAAGTLANTATVTAGAGIADPAPGNNSATDADSLAALIPVTIDQAVGQNDPTNAGTINFTVVFGQPVTGFADGDVTLTSPFGSLTQSITEIAPNNGTTYNVAVSGMSGNGTVTATVGAGVALGSFSQPNTASTSTDNTVTFDSDPPAVTIDQALGQADPSATAPINFTVVFDEPVANFTESDVTLGGTAPGTLSAAISGGPTTYTVAVSGMTGPGTVIATIAAGAVTDLAGNLNAASTSADNTVTFDPIQPVATGIVRAGPSPTNAASVDFSVTFSKPVTGVDASDFAITSSGVSGAAISSVSGSGTTWSVSVGTGTGDGSLGLNLADDDTIVDATGSPLGGKGAGNGDFTSGEIYTLDRTAPHAGSLAAADITTGGSTAQTFTIAVSDNLAIDLASLDGGDIRVTGPGGFDQPAALVGVTPAGNGTPRIATYQIAAPGGAWDIADNGTYTVALQANQVRDTAGNLASASTLGTFSVQIAAARYAVFLPAIQHAAAPDLAVAGISISPNTRTFNAGDPVIVAVTVTNQGSAAAGPFWVDLSINPSSPPTAANQIWNARCGLAPCFGMAWQVTSALAPGQSITLSSQSLPPGYSIWPGYFAAGTSDLYAYADSYSPGVAAGAVAESDETNNRAELHGLSVTGPNPALVGVQGISEVRAR